MTRVESMVKMRWFACPEGDKQQLRVEPQLASWDSTDHPSQVRSRAYLDDTAALLAASWGHGSSALRLDVGLAPERDLLNMADLDNYAYRLAYRLRDHDLVSVWCTKQHGDRSFIRIESARLTLPPSIDLFSVITTASTSTAAYKQQIRDAVAEACELPAGPVRLELAFVVGLSRNWMNLWKPTIDSLDPLLGRTHPLRAWHPLDGRITELGMHLTVDSALRHDVIVSIAATPSVAC